MFAKNRRTKWNYGSFVHLNGCACARKWHGLHADKWLTGRNHSKMVLIECAMRISIEIVNCGQGYFVSRVQMLCIWDETLLIIVRVCSLILLNRRSFSSQCLFVHANDKCHCDCHLPRRQNSSIIETGNCRLNTKSFTSRTEQSNAENYAVNYLRFSRKATLASRNCLCCL